MHLLQKQQKSINTNVNFVETIKSTKKQFFFVEISQRFFVFVSKTFKTFINESIKTINENLVDQLLNKNDSSILAIMNESMRKLLKFDKFLIVMIENEISQQQKIVVSFSNIASEIMQQNENVFAFTKTNSKYIESNIHFEFIDELIYHVKNNQSKLCIFNNCVQNVLKLIHDDCSHVEHYRTYFRFETIYIRNLFHRLSIYIKHFFFC